MIYKKQLENHITEWLKEKIRYKIGGNNYLERINSIDFLCAERAKWLIESMDFYAEGIVAELGERDGPMGI